MLHCTAGTGVLTRKDFAHGAGLRRCGPRLRVKRMIVIMPFGFRTGLQFRPAKLVDCSRNGVGIVTAEPLVPGEQFMVKGKLRQFVLLMYTVRYCERWKDGGYQVGGQFSGIIGSADDRDPSAVLDALLEGDVRECREPARSN
jgi:hypothetical protein